MKKLLPAVVLGTCFLSLSGGAGLGARVDDSAKKLYSHAVYFKLNDNSAEATKTFLASCKKYLSKHPGTVFYAAGTRDSEAKASSVRDKDFDIALIIVFDSKDAEQKYEVAEDHKQFIKENLANMGKVRVFDAIVEQ
jgi:hypothetical protein